MKLDTEQKNKLVFISLVLLFLIDALIIANIYSSKTAGGEIAKWVTDNPQAILDSVNNYAIKQQQEYIEQEKARTAENLKKYDADLKDTKYAGVLNPEGTIEIVEFYDYNCGYCKLASKSIYELLEKRDDVKVILKSIPILGSSSQYATQVGMAIIMSNNEKYPEYYKGLMEGSARDQASVDAVVEAIGLNLEDVKAYMAENEEAINDAIQINLDLAQNVGVNGTPAFIVNGELIPGAVDANTLESKLAK